MRHDLTTSEPALAALMQSLRQAPPTPAQAKGSSVQGSAQSDAGRQELWQHTQQMAQSLIAEGRHPEAEALLMQALHHLPDYPEAHGLLAQSAEARGDWQSAAYFWQLYAAFTNPITTKSRTHVVENPEEMLRISQAAQRELRRCRIALARQMRADGKQRPYAELISRIVETLSDQHALKSDPEVVTLLRDYIRQALPSRQDTALSETDLEPKHVLLCYDVLRPEVHKRALQTVRALLAIKGLQHIDLIETNERFCVTTPAVSARFNPLADDKLEEILRGTLKEEYDTRCTLRRFNGKGLEGVIETCTQLRTLRPDVVIFAHDPGGSRVSDSRLVRHSLFSDIPTVVLFEPDTPDTAWDISAPALSRPSNLQQHLTQAIETAQRRWQGERP